MYHQYLNSATSTLNYLDSDTLKELLNDEEKLDEKVIEAVTSLEVEKESMITENTKLATENLNKEPEIIDHRSKVMDLAEQGKTLCLQVQGKLNEIKEKGGDMNQDTALALLQTAEAQSEEESDNVVKQFLDKDNTEMTVELFLEKFMQIRKLMHLRKLKVEKMQELVRQPNYSSSSSMFPPSFYPSFQGNSHVPYPTGAIQMPMPGGLYRPY